MAAKELLLILVIQLLATCPAEEDVSCEVTIDKNPSGGNFNLKNNPNCIKNMNKTCPNFKIGRYICEERCHSYQYEAIGLGIAAGLMFLLFVVAAIGWMCTCCLLHKTTEFSLKPKGLLNLNQYEETLQPERNNSFHPLTRYTRFGQSHESVTVRGEKPTDTSEEGIYEVLDGDEEMAKIKGSSEAKRSVILSGGTTESYDTLQFEEHR